MTPHGRLRIELHNRPRARYSGGRYFAGGTTAVSLNKTWYLVESATDNSPPSLAGVRLRINAHITIRHSLSCQVVLERLRHVGMIASRLPSGRAAKPLNDAGK